MTTLNKVKGDDDDDDDDDDEFDVDVDVGVDVLQLLSCFKISNRLPTKSFHNINRSRTVFVLCSHVL